MDGGAQSPKETSLRLTLIDADLPAPRTQIRVSDGANEAFIDMGYDEPMVGLDYEGRHHSDDRGQYVYDIGRAELIERKTGSTSASSPNTAPVHTCIEYVRVLASRLGAAEGCTTVVTRVEAQPSCRTR